MGRKSHTIYADNARNFTPVYNQVSEVMQNDDYNVVDNFKYQVTIYTSTANTVVHTSQLYPLPTGYLEWDSSSILKNYIGNTLYKTYANSVFMPSTVGCNVINYRSKFDYTYDINDVEQPVENIITFNKLVWNAVLPYEYWPYRDNYIYQFEPSTGATKGKFLGSNLNIKEVESDEYEWNAMFCNNIYSNINVPFSDPKISLLQYMQVDITQNDGSQVSTIIKNSTVCGDGISKMPAEHLITHIGTGPLNINAAQAFGFNNILNNPTFNGNINYWFDDNSYSKYVAGVGLVFPWNITQTAATYSVLQTNYLIKKDVNYSVSVACVGSSGPMGIPLRWRIDLAGDVSPIYTGGGIQTVVLKPTTDYAYIAIQLLDAGLMDGLLQGYGFSAITAIPQAAYITDSTNKYTIKLLDINGVQVSEEKTYNINRRSCLEKQKKYRVIYLNKNGVYVWFSMNRNSNVTTEISRQIYNKYLPYNYSVGDRGDTVFAARNSSTFNLSTGYVKQEEMTEIEGVYTSNDVYLEYYDSIVGGLITIPVVVNQKDFTNKDYTNNKLLSATIEFTQANRNRQNL